MTAIHPDLDARIDQEHAAIERAEHDALQIVERLRKIPGTEGVLSRKRGYGECPNPWAGSGNLTAQASVIRADRQLAAWLASQAGKTIAPPDYQAEADAQRLAASASRMAAQTEALRLQNQANRQRQQRERNHGRWSSMVGRMV